MSKENKTEKLSPTEAAIEILSEVRERDPEAFAKLVEWRVDVNDRLAMHPGIPTRAQRGKHQMGLVSILNGLLALMGESKIASIVEDDVIVGFTASPMVKSGANGLSEPEILPSARNIAVG